LTTIVCTADLHEHLVDIPPCDLLLIAGDVSFAFKGDLATKQAFLAGEFKDWLDRVSAEEVVLVAGNHDQSVEAWGLPDGLRCHYLQDAEVELSGLRIWARPGSRGSTTGRSTHRAATANCSSPPSSTRSLQGSTSWSHTVRHAATATSHAEASMSAPRR
jgi:hypothetical protein